MNEIFVLLETGGSVALALLWAAFAASMGLLVFDRAPRKDTWTERAAEPPQRRAA